MSVSTGDQSLKTWSVTFLAGITPSPASLGLVVGQVTAFDAFLDQYILDLAAWDNDPTRSKNLTAAKHLSKGNLLGNARVLYDIVKHHPGVSDATLVSLGIHVDKTEDTPAPVLETAPALTVQKVYGRQFTLNVKDATGTSRGRAAGAEGYTVYSFIGATPPDGIDGWTSEGNYGKAKIVIALPPGVAPGTKVYFTANWFNSRHVSPGCTAVMTQVGVEGSLAA